VKDLKLLLYRRAAEVETLERREKMLRWECKRRDDEITWLEHEIGKMRDSYQGVVAGYTQRIRGMEERLKKPRIYWQRGPQNSPGHRHSYPRRTAYLRWGC
jgi:hypothetical protein